METIDGVLLTLQTIIKMKKNKVIKKIEKDLGIFYSEIKGIISGESLNKIENNKSLEIICGLSEFENKKLLFRNKLYKTPSGFYIYWEKRDDNTYDITIYHMYEHLSEIFIYLTQLTK